MCCLAFDAVSAWTHAVLQRVAFEGYCAVFAVQCCEEHVWQYRCISCTQQQ